MSSCSAIQAQFSEYLDGAVSGAEMHAIAAHLERCGECEAEFSEWRHLQSVLSSVGPARPPADLGLRLRVAISQEHARTTRRRLEGWQLTWENSLAPFLARGAAGLVTAVILLGAVGLMIGGPVSASANETVAESTSTPQLLYTVGGMDSRATFRQPVVVEAEVSPQGQVYSYRILSGPAPQGVREELDNFLLMSHFTPALFYGIPVPGVAVLSFSSTADHRG